MARLNISIPDALYERLDRLRDRVNASKVCAAALEKELTMVEGPALVEDSPDTKVARLIERLRTEPEKWLNRGMKAGESWAVEVATLGELNEFEQTWSGVDHTFDLMTTADRLDGWQDRLPESFTERDETIWDEPLEEDPTLRGAYLLGWYRGAMEIWRAARPQLMDRSD
jgi:hypothetical protein